MGLQTRKKIDDKLKSLGITFNEMDSRMNYGHIGNIICRGENVVSIFPSTFYVHSSNLSINKRLLDIIGMIQIEYKELRFKKR